MKGLHVRVYVCVLVCVCVCVCVLTQGVCEASSAVVL